MRDKTLPLAQGKGQAQGQRAAGDSLALGPWPPPPLRGGAKGAKRSRPFLLMVEVEGIPKAEPRPRATVRGKGKSAHASVYVPTDAHEWKHEVRAQARLAQLEEPEEPGGLIPLGVAVRVDTEFRFPRPKRHFRTGRYSGMLKADMPYFHTAKPDRDNLDKAVLDALGEFDGGAALVWADDAQVAAGSLLKRYAAPGEPPGATIIITLA